MPNAIEILAYIANEVADGNVAWVSLSDCPDCDCHGLHAPLRQYLDEDGIAYTCPVEETRWVRCVFCGWQQINSYSSEPRRIDDSIMCGDCADQYVECCECGTPVDVDATSSECFDTGHYCESCWTSRGGCSCPDCNGESDEEEIPTGESVHRCRTCGSRCDHMDLIDERFVCDHVAETLIAGFVPVKLARAIPAVTAVCPDPEWVDVVAEAMDEVSSDPAAA